MPRFNSISHAFDVYQRLPLWIFYIQLLIQYDYDDDDNVYNKYIYDVVILRGWLSSST